MKAILMKEFGNTDVLYVGEQPDLTIGEGDLLVRVKATALNRADLLQRRGLYPPPKGESEILGLEMAGEVIQVGSAVADFKVGDRVCSLLPGGGYAELAAIPAEMAMRLPDELSDEQGAAIPEVFLTAYLNLFWMGNLSADDTVLVHAGASGVGTAAIQLIREAGAGSLVTAGTSRKLERCMQLGARAGWDYHEGAFSDWVKEQTKGNGVNLIFDFIGAPYFSDNIKSLATDGRLIVIGMMGGQTVDDLSLATILSRRLQIIGTALRSRPLAQKIKLSKEFEAFAMPRFQNGSMQPIIDSVFSWQDVAKAHEYMESNQNIGKIVLKIDG